MSLIGTTLDANPPAIGTARTVRAPLVVVAGAGALGIVIDRLAGGGHHASGIQVWWLAGATAIAIWWWLQRCGREKLAALLLVASFACAAGCWHHWCWNYFSASDLGRFAHDDAYPCCIEAVAIASPERIAAPQPSPFRAIPVGEKSQLPLRITRVRNGKQWRTASGECELVVDGHLLGVGVNDQLRVFCQIRSSSPPRNPGQFDFAAYARADRQLCFLRCGSPECVIVIEKGSGWLPWRAIDHLRADWRKRLWAALGDRRAPMAAAVLLGARSSIPREDNLPFMVTGAMHVLVVSGLHAGIFVSLIFVALGMGFVPRRWALVIAMLLVAGYALLTGAHPPVVRAAVLAELMCIALWFEKNPFALNSLAAAALVVLAMNPADLFRTGPQLSFLCAAVLLWFASVQWQRQPSPLEKLIRDTRPWYSRSTRSFVTSIGLIMAATLAVWIVSLPLIAHQYHLVTPVAVLASPLLFPAVVLTLLSGFAFLVGGWIIPPAAPYLAEACGGAVALLDWVVHVSQGIPAGHAWTPSPSTWWVIGWFVLVAISLRTGGARWGWRRTLQLVACWIVIGALPVIARQWKTKPLEVAFLDVGHGASVVVTTPEGTTLLYDAGSIGSPSFATETIAGYFWSRGNRAIDVVVLSHADVDHFNAMPGLLERFRIGRVFVTPMMFPRNLDPNDRSAPAELRRLLDAHGVPVEVVLLGDRLTLDRQTHAEVLYPDRLGNLGSDNANSMVLAVEHGRRRVLLPGDLESPGIEDVMEDDRYDCEVLLAPHHGSRRSDPPGFAAWSTPEWVVISGGGNLGGAEVAASYRHQGAEVLTTGISGAIEFFLREDEIEFQAFLED
ncbi:MAG: ComEC/Rec2 family competence protein [Aeoliella sp.]